MLTDRLSALLARREQNQSLRQLRLSDNLVDFASNDYLSLARRADLRQQVADFYQQYLNQQPLTAATGSRLLTGHSRLYQQLEEELADFYQSETALMFNSGYDANVGLLCAVCRKNDLIIHDELAHASIYDAIQFSQTPAQPFAHNDCEHLERLLTQAKPKGCVFVAIESVYSMDGDIAPLSEIVRLCQQHGAYLLVDEAHAVGVLGRSLVQNLGLEKQVWARLQTFGKAIGAHGAAILSDNLLKNYLINYCRPLIYTTALPPHGLISVLLHHRFLAQNPQLLTELEQKLAFYQQTAANLGLKLQCKPSAIQTLPCPSNPAAKRLAQGLQQAGFDARPIFSPTVPIGQERVRICLHLHNSEAEISQLLFSYKQLIESNL